MLVLDSKGIKKGHCAEQDTFLRISSTTNWRVNYFPIYYIAFVFIFQFITELSHLEPYHSTSVGKLQFRIDCNRRPCTHTPTTTLHFHSVYFHPSPSAYRIGSPQLRIIFSNLISLCQFSLIIKYHHQANNKSPEWRIITITWHHPPYLLLWLFFICPYTLIKLKCSVGRKYN